MNVQLFHFNSLFGHWFDQIEFLSVLSLESNITLICLLLLTLIPYKQKLDY